MNWTEEQWAEHCERLIYGGQPTASGPAPLEAVIEAECTKILEADGWRALRTDPVSDRGRGKGFGELGMADHLYIRYPSPAEQKHYGLSRGGFNGVMWVEFKRPGESPKKHQIAWHIRERARGALTLIAGVDFEATVAGFQKWYAASGLMALTERVEG